MQLRAVFPSDFSDLLLLFSDGSPRVLSYSPGELSFMAFPVEGRALRYSAEGIHWRNGQHYTAQQLYDRSEKVASRAGARWFLLGSKNNAPTETDQHHHVYYVHLHPLNPEQPFMLCESIGGGHGESGGCTGLSIADLFTWPHDWKTHFRKADCAWAIGCVEEYREDAAQLMQKTADYLFERAYLQMPKNKQ
jgi:hypothetical protein